MNKSDLSPYANHDRVWLLLPWYANGTLREAEAEMVRKHLRICLRCHREMAIQYALAKNLREDMSLEIPPQPSFERLMSRVRRDERRAGTAAGFFRTGWFAWLRDFSSPAYLTAAAVSGVLAVTLSFLLGETPVGLSAGYRTVADRGSFDPYTSRDIRVAFGGQATETQIAEILNSVHGQIVAGPTPLGVFTVRIASAGAPEYPVSQPIARLRENPAVILAEPALP